MKIGFYSFTVGPANMLKEIASTARLMRHEALVFKENEPGVVATRKEEMSDCDIVAIGLDSARPEEGLELAEYLFSLDIPVVAIEDTPGSVLRPMAKPFAPKFKCCIVAREGGIGDALAFGFSRVQYVGPPPHWGVSYRQMMEGPSIRPHFSKIVGGQNVQLDPKDKVIYVPGTKIPEIVNTAISGAIKAGKQVLGDNFVFCCRRHPGEKPNEKVPDDAERFERLFAEREDMLKGVTMLEPGKANNPQLVRAADVTIFPGGGPTESIIAAYARIPTIYCWGDVVSRELKKIGIDSGKWFVAELGGSMKVEGEEVVIALSSLLGKDGWMRNNLRALQEKNFPLPDTWDTSASIIAVLADIVRART